MLNLIYAHFISRILNGKGGGEKMRLNIIHTKSEYYCSGDRLIKKKSIWQNIFN